MSDHKGLWLLAIVALGAAYLYNRETLAPGEENTPAPRIALLTGGADDFFAEGDSRG